MVLNIVNILLAQYFLNNVQYFDFNRGKKRQNRTFWLQSGKKASKNRKIPGRVVDLKCWILKSSLPQRYESTSRSTCFPRCSSSRRHKDCSVDLFFFRCCRRSVKQSPKTWKSQWTLVQSRVAFKASWLNETDATVMNYVRIFNRKAITPSVVHGAIGHSESVF